MVRATSIWKRAGKWLLVLVAVIAALPALTGNSYIYRGFRATYLMGRTTANIDDAAVFDQRIIRAGTPQPWPVSPQYNRQPMPADLLAYHQQQGTAAWLVVPFWAIVAAPLCWRLWMTLRQAWVLFG